MTTYRATATKNGRWWAVEIHDLPEGMIGVTQGRDIADARAMARDAAASLLGVPEQDIDIDLRVDGTDELLDDLAAARRRRDETAKAEQAILADVLQDLVGRGLTQKDAAQLVGLSPQRVAQLAPRRSDIHSVSVRSSDTGLFVSRKPAKGKKLKKVTTGRRTKAI